MISSCSDCKTKCCRSGPGPYNKVSVEDWVLRKVEGSKRYNTACEHFNTDTEECEVWETALPLQCAVYVCGVRTYTGEELEKIDELLDENKRWMESEKA